MKKLYNSMAVVTLMFGFSQALSAQTVLFGPEDFEGTMDATTGIPIGWQETGLSTDGIWSVGTDVEANSAGFWPVPAHTLFAQSNDDACDCDKSEDRLILPEQDFSALTGFVSLKADLYQDGNYSNTGQVEVSTDAGATWTLVYEIPASADWQDNSTIDLTAYVGEPQVWIAFRQNDAGAWATGLGVDNVSIENTLAPEPDASVAGVLGEYTIVPLTQVGSPIATSAVITNSGNADITNAVVSSTVYDGAMNVLHTETSAPVATIAPAGSETVSLTGYTPTAVDAYMVLHIVSIDEADVTSGNDSTMYTFVVSDSVYARDNGIAEGSLGIGSGDPGQLGQEFSVTALDTMTSVSMQISNASGNMTDKPISATIYDTDPVTGEPLNVIGTTEEVIVSATPDSMYTCVLTNALELAPGTYVVVANETDENITLATSSSIYTAGATWVIFGGNPWANSEDYNFNVAYLLRPNFGEVVESTVGLDEANSSEISIYPNPSAGNFNLNISNVNTASVDVEITDVSGKVILSNVYNTNNGSVNESINISNVDDGVYIVRVNGGQTIVKRIVISNK